MAAAMVFTPSMAAVCCSVVESAFHRTVTTCRMVDGVPYLFCACPIRIPAQKTAAAPNNKIAYFLSMLSLHFFGDSRGLPCRGMPQSAPIFAYNNGVGGITRIVLYNGRTRNRCAIRG